MSIPVICDRCRSTATAGTGDFSHLGDLLEFAPVPRKTQRADGWTPDKQRAFIAALSATGSRRQAAQAIGMAPYGAEQLLKSEGSDSFKAAVERAMAIAAQHGSMKIAQGVADAAARKAQLTPPSRLRGLPAAQPAPLPGQVLNEFGNYEDEASLERRGEEARDSIAQKLLRTRRLFLKSISESPGKRAAFEILTELPVDWEKAKLVEPQPDEPWRRPNMHQPDMVLTAETGWAFGEMGYGPDKKAERLAELRAQLDAYHVEHRLPPIDWDSDDPCGPYLEQEEARQSAERSDADA
jgi:hypothetical protein